MIKDKETFSQIASLISSDGWKLFEAFMQTKIQGSIKNAISGVDDKSRLYSLDEARTFKNVIDSVYGEYKLNYDKYKGEI